ncbi:MAG: CapA family protein, partial [Acidobacteria bacterium]|nr:CapA family protein [Acidobacteriota bacterium]
QRCRLAEAASCAATSRLGGALRFRRYIIMPGAQSVLIPLCLLAAGQDARLLFTGDILLSRQVRAEINRTGRFPWQGFTELFRQADWVAGNLEGAVGEAAQCLPKTNAGPCFDIAPEQIPLLAKAGFHALGVANNHALDLGAAGRDATRGALRKAGLDALSYEDSPAFFRIRGHAVAVIALNMVPARDGSRGEVPSIALRQKLRLARELSELVIVFIHWGSELLDWPDAHQRQAARWLVDNGADLIAGQHPHVVQPAECLNGRPVFYSLGNHLFDQKYPATKQGWIADCRIRGGELRCGAIATATPPGSAIPLPAGAMDDEALRGCPVKLTAPVLHASSMASGDYVIEGGAWRSRPLPLLSAEAGKFKGPSGPGFLFTLQRHHSPIDQEQGVRPYVYEVGPNGLVARWRGSALAWPLLDAALLPGGEGILCALHRRDSFLLLQPGADGTRTAAYRWNGFGFTGIEDPAVAARCRALLP